MHALQRAGLFLHRVPRLVPKQPGRELPSLQVSGVQYMSTAVCSTAADASVAGAAAHPTTRLAIAPAAAASISSTIPVAPSHATQGMLVEHSARPPVRGLPPLVPE